MDIKYEALERIAIIRPVHRIAYIVRNIRNKRVLDLGSYDETALQTKSAEFSLFRQISLAASSTLGIDNSVLIPANGISIGDNSRIIKGDVNAIAKLPVDVRNFDTVVAGELIEHLNDTLAFLKQIKAMFPGKELICSTPNSVSLSNVLLGVLGRESTHRDHLHVFSCKTLNTLCIRCNFKSWDIIPYYVCYTEMIHESGAGRRIIVEAAEKLVNMCEYIFPLLSGGLILHVTKI